MGNGGNDTILGGDNNDTLDGGAGIDWISFAGANSQVKLNLVAGATENNFDGFGDEDTVVNFENILGGNNNDILTGDTGDNIIDGGAGNDTIDAGDGNDTILYNLANGGTDSVTGGAGADSLKVSDSAGGNDTIGFTDSGSGFKINASTYNMVESLEINSGAGNDTFNVNGSVAGGNDILLFGGDGADTFNIVANPNNKLIIDGGAPGFDVDPADSINVTGGDNALKILAPGQGRYNVSGQQLITFSNIELAQNGTIPVIAFYGDFNGTSGVTATDFIGIEQGVIYGKNGNSFGWVDDPAEIYDGAANVLDRGTSSFPSPSPFVELLRDGAWGRSNNNPAFPWLNNPNQFNIDLPNGEYFVTVTAGDTFVRNFLQVMAEGEIKIDGASNVANNKANEWGQYTFVIEVLDGTLNLEFSTEGGDKYWVVNALEIVPLASVADVTFTSANPTANSDGFDQVTITGDVVGSSYNGLLTVAAELGTIASPDQDPYLKGVQVQATDGGFSFLVTVPTVTGAETFTAFGPFGDVASVNLQGGMAPTILTYELQDRRYDFNRVTAQGSSPTLADWLGVSTAAYNATLGYGYSNPFTTNSVTAIGFDRSTVTDALTRDGHFGQSGGSTFDIQVDANESYDVTIHFGDSFAVRTGMEVKFEGGAWMLLDGLTDADRFNSLTFSGISSTDDRLSMTFRVNPAVPNTGYWTVNGIGITN